MFAYIIFRTGLRRKEVIVVSVSFFLLLFLLRLWSKVVSFHFRLPFNGIYFRNFNEIGKETSVAFIRDVFYNRFSSLVQYSLQFRSESWLWVLLLLFLIWFAERFCLIVVLCFCFAINRVYTELLSMHIWARTIAKLRTVIILTASARSRWIYVYCLLIHYGSTLVTTLSWSFIFVWNISCTYLVTGIITNGLVAGLLILWVSSGQLFLS